MRTRNLPGRLKKLERRREAAGEKEMLVLIKPVCGELNWEKSTCDRLRNSDGSITTVVWLEGCDELTDEALQQFIAQHPIKDRDRQPIEKRWGDSRC